MDFNIRQEQIKDYEAVHKVVELAFRDMEDSDHSEPFLVDQLRQTDALSQSFHWLPRLTKKLSAIS